MNDSLLTKASPDSGKAVLYLRVSTEEQVDNYSLETQENICKKEAERKNLEIMQIFREEGRSAKTITGRPALVEMLEFCRKNKRVISTVIIYRLDRISRLVGENNGSAIEAEELAMRCKASIDKLLRTNKLL